MPYSLAEVLNKSTYDRTETNYSVTSIYVAMVEHVLDACERRGLSPKKVKFGDMNRRDDNRFSIHVYYG